uniref:Nudix hydrolase domain-containing protein n=1 Tax=Pseudictyota dubia TaxID=2749911 RepID=A0A6U2GQK2_9STRA|mmetsp:Transcript_44616/g.82754  ORF Transcript_44616/g.82754 Transcript_44616/m.82754 type:complete len:258 (+) Transcript_44616:176-949(+)
MFDTPQFVTGPFTPRRVFLPDREYGLALDALVKGCSDVLLVSASGERVLLGRRRVEPQPDWWFVGGRSRPGDTTSAAAARNVKRELGLDFPEDRFEVVANYSMVWSYREQAPTDNGTADLSTVHALHLTDEEEKAGVPALDPKEYHESRWWGVEEIIGGGDRFHPCLVNAVKALKAKSAYRKLERLASDVGDSDAEDIAKHAVEFVKAMQEAKSAKRSVKVVFDVEGSKYVDQDENTAKRQKSDDENQEGKKSESSS